MTYSQSHTRIVSSLLLMTGLSFSSTMMASTPSPSTTTLSISGSSVPIRTLLTLTATVTSSGKAVAPGMVNFCNATAKFCEDSALLGQAQLTQAGTATLKLILPLGEHSVKAVFQGTNLVGGSQSAEQSVDVFGKHATTTNFSVSGVPGNYTLSAQVTSLGVPDLTGTVIFPDTTHYNIPVARAQLGPASLIFGTANPPTILNNTPVFSADLNGDGWPDLILADSEIALGNGDGTFTMKPPVITGYVEGTVIGVGDFNGDDIPDFVAHINGAYTVLLGKGDGTFKETAPLVMPDGNFNVLLGDFNGDGNLDLVMVGANYTANQNQVQLLLGKGDGTFTPLPAQSLSAFSPPVAADDFNGDGKTDLAFAGEGIGGLQILLSKGDGTFTQLPPSGIVTCTQGCNDMEVADFNGDGKPDLVVTDGGWDENGLIPGAYHILLGNGDGTFVAGGGATGCVCLSVAVGDFDGDGKADLVVEEAEEREQFLSFSTTLLLGAGDGTFAFAYGFADAQFVLGDFNRDGRTDLVSFYGFPMEIELSQSYAFATATGVSVTGAGTHHVFAQYKGDLTHLGSSSKTWALLPK